MIDRLQISELLRRIARQEILPRFGQLERHEVRSKKKNDPVTIADEAAERALIPALQSLVASSLVIGEESVSADPELMARHGRADYLWLVDPIDGTANYAAGRPIFGTMAAFLDKGIPVGGWIHFPLEDVTLSAAKGEGAFWGSKPLTKSQAVDIEKPVGIISGSPRKPEWRRLIAKAENDVIRKASRRCSAMHYRQLALGEIDFILSFDTYPWDHAPGIAIITELGGYAGAGHKPYALLTDQPQDFILSAKSRDIWHYVSTRLLGA